MRSEDSANINAICRMSRRTFVKMGIAAGAFAFGGTLNAFGQLPPLTGCAIQEVFPTSPFIVTPFIDALPQLTTMAPGWRPDPTITVPQADWTVQRARFLGADFPPGVVVPGPAEHQQDAYGHQLKGATVVNGQGHEQTCAVEHDGTHQVWPVPGLGPNAANFNRLNNWPAAGVPPILYHIRMQLGKHKFTTSKVRPINSLGAAVIPPAGAPVTLDANGLTTLPDSVIYGFNGTFPGAMINVEYGKPAIIRFENDLDKNPLGLDRQNFGAPDFAFLTHLHNGHTAPESDGNPHYMQINEGGYTPGDWVDNLYLNYPAGGDPSEIQSFVWFHDHRMHHTGANVYKGMVGLMPQYDPGMPHPNNPGQILPGTGLDTGNESDPAPNLGLPGVRVNHPDGSFDVKYDIHMALYDCVLDDGITPHADLHTDVAACGATHPEWWGKAFFKHFPGKGFVGDLFTVNCTAYPVLNVFQRKYRFRFLGASVVRIYELALMTSAAGPVPMLPTQGKGQWQIPDGVQWKPWTFIANMGGLLPQAINTNSFHLWPASRHEFVVDFTNIPTGTEIYITNVLVMDDGLKPTFNNVTTPADLAALTYKVPLVKIVVGGLPPETDQSAVIASGTPLRPMPKLANGGTITLATTAALPQKEFSLTKGGPGIEETWVIALEPGASLPFNPLVPLTRVVRDQPEVWTTKNGGGGWVHPMHMHQEEHTVLARAGSKLSAHPEDAGKADVANLEQGESVTFYRNFRTFTGRYVAHCHNLAHEDHNMMFGWTILGAAPVGVISGTVTNRGVAPLPGVEMTLAGAASATGTTDLNGNYSFTGLPNGSYTVTPSLPGFGFIVASRKVTLNGANMTRRNFIGV